MARAETAGGGRRRRWGARLLRYKRVRRLAPALWEHVGVRERVHKVAVEAASERVRVRGALQRQRRRRHGSRVRVRVRVVARACGGAKKRESLLMDDAAGGAARGGCSSGPGDARAPQRTAALLLLFGGRTAAAGRRERARFCDRVGAKNASPGRRRPPRCGACGGRQPFAVHRRARVRGSACGLAGGVSERSESYIVGRGCARRSARALWDAGPCAGPRQHARELTRAPVACPRMARPQGGGVVHLPHGRARPAGSASGVIEHVCVA